jgi:hypothetical protein
VAPAEAPFAPDVWFDSFLDAFAIFRFHLKRFLVETASTDAQQARQDSNLQPSDLESDALANSSYWPSYFPTRNLRPTLLVAAEPSSLRAQERV